VHLFPERLAAAVRAWFESYGWPIRYPFAAKEALDYLLGRGVSRVLALPYAHKPGMARTLNAFVADLAREEPRAIPGATVFPGEERSEEILREAFAAGARAVKIHCHVQCVAPDDARLDEVFATCASARVPVVMHAGREPASPHYKCDVHALCSAEKVERALLAHPDLTLVVPHLGADEYRAFGRLLERHENLWLDTTMVLAGYFPGEDPAWLLSVRPERILYGSDFPNLPYAWDRELKRIGALGLGEERLAGLLGGNAMRLYGDSAGS
jgi:predicted TIM-barrel fold metal-dependent hydrolase